ncbi:hypothetical protein FOZ60_003984 [Perkinsus olseni]|uniref:Enoyl reductase (ER) domain-containing protein n=2 Tax=Perkinsus olseni TaxID=32597 RepID=A0A7J6NU00_PEROL|nr:hypothetical protein FOZ60_003984 [Perkinsus olseni]
MRAFVYDSSPSGMGWVNNQAVPQPTAAQVQVKVIAAATNPIDLRLAGMPVASRWLRGTAVGFDFAGRVTIGSGDYKVGDLAFGKTKSGSMAEFATADVNEIAHVPEGVDPKVAASLPVASLVSLQALRHGGVTEAGKNVLVIGGSGGTGSSGVQIAKSLGAKVYAVCSGKNSDFVKSLGADVVMDYTKEGFKLPNEDCPAGTIDVVYDTVTSPEDFNYEPTARQTLKKGGMYVAIETPSLLDRAKFWLSRASGRNIQRPQYSMWVAQFNHDDLAKLGNLAAKGKLRVQFAEELPFSEGSCCKAYQLQRSRHARGKILLLSLLMKAFVYGQEDPDKYLWHDNFDVPEPENKKQVQVKVFAAALNPVDYKLPHLPRGGRVKGQPIGYDFAGRVTRTTDGCEYKEDDMVFGKALKGCLAEYTLTDVDHIARVPPQIEPKIAAALPVASLFSLQVLRHGGCGENEGKGKSVLVIGASGGVGSSAVQIAKANGCKVYAVCDPSNIDFVKSLGADVVMDYSKEGFELPNEDCPAGTMDMVFDSVTSPVDPNYEPTARRTLKAGCKYICGHSPSKMDWARYLVWYYTGINVQRKNYSLLWTNTNPTDLNKLSQLVMDGKLKINISDLPFNEANCRKAYKLLKSRRTKGKIVIVME